MNKYEKCLHTEHCTTHNCKYGDGDCPVMLGLKPTSYPDNDHNYDYIDDCDSGLWW